MAAALADDFLRLPNLHVEMLADSRVLPQLECLQGVARLHITAVDSPDTHGQAFGDLSKNCDRTLLIAPEFQGHLARMTRLAEQRGGQLLSPNSDFVAYFSDKQHTLERLGAHGVRTPPGCVLTSPGDLPDDWNFPAVAKPNDGAGSCGVRCVRRRAEVEALDWDLGPYRLEQLCVGTAASVALLLHGSSACVLAPCLQRLADDGSFSYLGGSVMAVGPLAQRATTIGRQVARVLPSAAGYVGVDLVLGDAADGSADFVIEVNPRITTSYVGLRACTDENLAEAILHAAGGGAEGDLRFPRRPLEFRADGTILADSN